VSFDFFEVGGVLDDDAPLVATQTPRVVVSSLRSGGSRSAAAPQMALKYVAAGIEVYAYRGRKYPVSAGQFLAVPAGTPGEVEIGRSADGSALGLCVYLAQGPGGLTSSLDAPMLFPAQCSSLGRLLVDGHRRLLKTPHDKKAIAASLMTAAANDIEPLLEETVGLLCGMDSARPATRYETLRRLNVARAYLHSVTDRAVDLDELSRVAGASRFHLLRNFRSCFGDPPAAYHRRLRLELAREEIEARRLGCAEAAHRFGFADSSSFIHAYRRTYGEPPMRSVSGRG